MILSYYGDVSLRKKIKGNIIYVRNQLWYIIAIAIMAFASGGMLVYEFFAENSHEILFPMFQDLDLAIAYIFLVDFTAGVYAAPKKIHYIIENWLDMFGSIPFSDGFFRALRILKFTRLVRFLKIANTGLNIKGSVRDLKHNHRKKKIWKKR